MPLTNTVSQNQFQIVIPGIQGAYFSKMSAPQEKRVTTKYMDPQAGREYTHASFFQTEDVTLTHIYTPEVASAVAAWWQGWKTGSGTKFTCTAQPVAADVSGNPLTGASPMTLTGCQPISVKGVDVDRSGTSMAMIEIVLAVDEISLTGNTTSTTQTTGTL